MLLLLICIGLVGANTTHLLLAHSSCWYCWLFGAYAAVFNSLMQRSFMQWTWALPSWWNLPLSTWLETTFPGLLPRVWWWGCQSLLWKRCLPRRRDLCLRSSIQVVQLQPNVSRRAWSKPHLLWKGNVWCLGYLSLQHRMGGRRLSDARKVGNCMHHNSHSADLLSCCNRWEDVLHLPLAQKAAGASGGQAEQAWKN